MRLSLVRRAVCLASLLIAPVMHAQQPTPSDTLLAPCPGTPNCVSTEATRESQRVPTVPFTDAPEAALARAKAGGDDALAALVTASFLDERIEYRAPGNSFSGPMAVSTQPPHEQLHFFCTLRSSRNSCKPSKHTDDCANAAGGSHSPRRLSSVIESSDTHLQ